MAALARRIGGPRQYYLLGGGALPENALGAQFLWDARRGYSLSGSLVTALEEQVGHLAADTLAEATPANQYTYTASNSDFGGYPTIGDDVNIDRTLECAMSVDVSQPLTIVIVGKWAADDANRYLCDQNTITTKRIAITGGGTIYRIRGDTGWQTLAGATFQTSQAEALYFRVNDASTTLNRYLRDGSRTGPHGIGGAIGANAMRGLALKQYSSPLAGTQGQIAIFAIVPGSLSAAAQTNFEHWLRGNMVWT